MLRETARRMSQARKRLKLTVCLKPAHERLSLAHLEVSECTSRFRTPPPPRRSGTFQLSQEAEYPTSPELELDLAPCGSFKSHATSVQPIDDRPYNQGIYPAFQDNLFPFQNVRSQTQPEPRIRSPSVCSGVWFCHHESNRPATLRKQWRLPLRYLRLVVVGPQS
jgi:hypothetical protein